eukprot:CAMPEP_0118702160 /NCGR_PEP_ID=MMETSP0800-20121206/17710_1 /TAXON_ID=210618 ORGANISM="Striatella unipunctata, Strain CCMP2910" /NCGR_SAMPLE_ID=MMETSP0800 /ASSEMBLY_ACC=CAM_ASM_000638 /LENGTH=39 /DNA_ID= /DNA_START= /DNA_END= /DNA_ORIENTATION=
MTLSTLGLLHYQNQDHTGALDMYQESLMIRRNTIGENNL